MLTLPIHDLPTRSASGFLMKHVMPRSVPPQLIGPLDRKQLFQIQTIGDCIIGTGHGSPDQFAGHNDQVMMDINNLPDVNGKLIILLSCETAQQLGPDLVSAGAAGYIGWKEDFVWVADADSVLLPWRDKFAAPVLMPVMQCVNMVLDGQAVGEAYNAMLSAFDENAAVEEDELIKSCIQFNRKNAVLLGDSTAKIRATPKIKFPIPPPPIIFPIST